MPRKPGRPIGRATKAILTELPITVAKPTSKLDQSLPEMRGIKVAGRWKGKRVVEEDTSLPIVIVAPTTKIAKKVFKEYANSINDFTEQIRRLQDKTPT